MASSSERADPRHAFVQHEPAQSKGLGFDGITGVGQGQAADPDLGLNGYYTLSPFTMFLEKIPYDDLLQKQRRELDEKKRKDLWRQIQRAWVDDMTTFIAPIPGLAQTLGIAWPQFENYPSLLSWNGYDTEMVMHYWQRKA